MTYQPNQQAELQTAIKAISSQCDGAIVRDGVGFNASDTTLGKSLALLPAILWDQDVAAAAWGMLSHYRAQLTALSIDFDKIDQVKPTTSEREGRRSAIHHAHAAVQSSKVSERSTLTLNASGVIILTSPYNGDLLKDVRAVAGRSWDAQHNVNRFPAESVRAVLDLAAKWNIPVPATIEALPDATLIDQTEADKEPEPLGLEIDDDKIIIRFPYHPDVNQDLRMMVTGSVFSSIGHCWKTDISNSIGALKFATKHGLTIQPGLAERIQKEEENQEELHVASMALDADIDIPSAIPLLPFQRAGVAYLLKTRRAILADEMGVGKLQPVTEPILTPDGWQPIGKIEVGDQVIGRDGSATTVTGVFPQGIMEIVRVAFNDGTWTDCGWDHLWTVANPANKEFVLTTRQMFDGDVAESFNPKNGRTYKTNLGLYDGAGNRRWHVPLVGAPEFNPQKLPVDPYVLGVYLGDGTWSYGSCGLSLNGMDSHEIIHNLNTNNKSRRDGPNSVATRLGRAIGRDMGDLGLAGCRSWEKFVPPQYLLGTPAQRLALLQGLLDTDGECFTHSGGVGFSSTSEALADAVVELLQSLGGIGRKSDSRVTHYRRVAGGPLLDGRPSWRVNCKLPPELTPFRVSRKLYDWKVPTKYPPRRMIDSITPTGRSEESVCIKVAAADELYVTRSYVVTHNTCQALAAAVVGGALPIVVVCPNTLKLNWKLEVEKFFPELSVTIVSGRSEADIEPADVIVVNYDIVDQRCEDIINLIPRVLIADEAHAIKNGEQKYQCPLCHCRCRVNSKHCTQCSQRFDKPEEIWTVRRTHGVMKLARAIPPDGMVMLLSGTPITNRPVELIPQLIAINRMDDFGGRWKFINRYAPGKTGAANLVELNDILRSRCFIRRLKKDVFDELPELRNAKQMMTIAPDKMAVYVKIEADVIEYLSNRARELAEEAGEDGRAAYWEKRMRAEAAEHLVRISALKNAVAELKYDAQIKWIEEFLEDSDEKIVVFAEHINTVEQVAAHFGNACVKIRGGVSQANRMAAVERFQTDPTCRVFIGNMAAASEGVTLTAASNVAYLEQAWTPAVHAQCASRCYGRADSPHGATAWWLLAPRTIDEDIFTLLAAKEKVVNAATEGREVEKLGSVLADLLVGLAKRGLTNSDS